MHCTVHQCPVMMTTSQIRKHFEKTPNIKYYLEALNSSDDSDWASWLSSRLKVETKKRTLISDFALEFLFSFIQISKVFFMHSELESFWSWFGTLTNALWNSFTLWFYLWPFLWFGGKTRRFEASKMGAFLEKPKTEKYNESKTGAGLRYGLSSMQGWRLEMEDAHSAVIGIPDIGK